MEGIDHLRRRARRIDVVRCSLESTREWYLTLYAASNGWLDDSWSIYTWEEYKAEMGACEAFIASRERELAMILYAQGRARLARCA